MNRHSPHTNPAEDIQPELIHFAGELADAARPVALHYFRNPLEVEHKADSSPVTVADRTVESTMREMIAARYPHHGILGEEHGRTNIEGAETWVLDPIDGTQSFITGMPTFGTLIAFLHHGQPRLGVIDMPALGERWLGVAGQQTTLNGAPCHTRPCSELTQASVYATSVDIFTPHELDALNAVTQRAALRRFGGDCYSYALLAAGYVDVVMESSLKPYDFLPLAPIIEGAGGIITDWAGKTLHLGSNGQVIAAATPELHAEILSTLPEAFR